MRSAKLFRVTKTACTDWSCSNKCAHPWGEGFGARISSKIIAVIRLGNQERVDYSCFNEPFADSSLYNMILDMHGLIFYLSISPLAGSTRYLLHERLPSLQIPEPLTPSQRPGTRSAIKTNAHNAHPAHRSEAKVPFPRSRRWTPLTTSKLTQYAFLTTLLYRGRGLNDGSI